MTEETKEEDTHIHVLSMEDGLALFQAEAELARQDPVEPVDIHGLDERVLLKTLWDNTRPCAFFRTNKAIPAPKYDPKEAEKAIENRWVDYLCGRCFKFRLGTESVCPKYYDEDAGKGTMARVVAALRTKLT